ncbi:VOC family protein [Rubellimicrobium aerolatum]|uniref:VOC family protein n=1 Tax=Rubellimicrobium aerolatum TaxID=490979 RepID=A0ABW0SBK5_9RHOB|nr:VOC family protein [Rubellimicrobium aerolatum]MBP1805868.1 catechol 2,3-dioxygenase-like lactoylglutathione lyase family enzyme [Rubellimicrobium aerolatum]
MPKPEPPALILETAIYAEDLAAAESFYAGVMGLEVVGRQAGRHLFLRCGAGMLLVFDPRATAVVDPEAPLPVPPHGATGPGHLCFAAEPLGLETWRARLEAAGLPIEAVVDWPRGGRSIYLRDPAGNSLEVAEARIWGG